MVASPQPGPRAPRRVRPILVLPAALCLVAGAVLGTWGWTQRDESRAAIVEVPDTTLPFNGPSGSMPFDTSAIDPSVLVGDEYLAQTCEILQAAARLQPPPGYTPPPTSSTTAAPGPATTVPPTAAEAQVVVDALDLDVVLGVPALDQPHVLRAMSQLREAIQDALVEGGNWRADELVTSRSFQLAQVLQATCP